VNHHFGVAFIEDPSKILPESAASEPFRLYQRKIPNPVRGSIALYNFSPARVPIPVILNT
jgi:hypothetical protein